MERTLDPTTSNNKVISRRNSKKLNSANPDKNIYNRINAETVKKCDNDDLNFSKAYNNHNGSAFVTSDDSTTCTKGENNEVCNSSNSLNDCVSKKSKSAKNIGSFVGGNKKASIAVSDVDGRAFDILLK